MIKYLFQTAALGWIFLQTDFSLISTEQRREGHVQQCPFISTKALLQKSQASIQFIEFSEKVHKPNKNLVERDLWTPRHPDTDEKLP